MYDTMSKLMILIKVLYILRYVPMKSIHSIKVLWSYYHIICRQSITYIDLSSCMMYTSYLRSSYPYVYLVYCKRYTKEVSVLVVFSLFLMIRWSSKGGIRVVMVYSYTYIFSLIYDGSTWLISEYMLLRAFPLRYT